MLKSNKKLYEKALKVWGEDAQVLMLFEEIGELMTLICHAGRNTKTVFKCDLITEMADVQIMLEQMQLLFSINDSELRDERLKKLKRLKQRLEMK